MFYHSEVCYEEQDVEKSVKSACLNQNKDFKLFDYWGNTLYDIKDLPFTVNNMPLVQTYFRKALESKSKIRPCVPIPKFK